MIWMILIGAAFGALLYYWITKLLLRLKLRKRFSHASLGEEEAAHFLEEMGYILEETQKSSLLSMWINGEKHAYRVRPDAFARKDGELYLVEIKTGSQATNPKYSATRRQLLEYFHGFEVDGVLLVNADEKKIHQVHFDKRAFEPKEGIEQVVPVRSFKPLVWAFVLGILSALIGAFLCR